MCYHLCCYMNISNHFVKREGGAGGGGGAKMLSDDSLSLLIYKTITEHSKVYYIYVSIHVVLGGFVK